MACRCSTGSRGDLPPSAPAIIHLHGFAISGTYLLPAVNLLAAHFQTNVPDLPEFGRSAEPDPPDYGAAGLVEAELAIMDMIHIEKPTLPGTCNGYIVAFECAQISASD
jgi:pimeloyl-ACP methyl ester carboxylesterase